MEQEATAPTRTSTRTHPRRRAGAPVVCAAADSLAALIACAVVAPPRAALFLPLLWVALVAAAHGYRTSLVPKGAEGLGRVVRAGLALAVVCAAASWFADLPTAPGTLLVLVAITTLLSLLHRATAAGTLGPRRLRGQQLTRRVLLVGHHHQVAGVLSELGRTRTHGFDVVGASLHGKHRDRPLPVPSAGGLDAAATSARDLSADAVIVLPCKHLDAAALRRLGWELEASRTQLLVVPGLTDVAETRTTMTTVGSMPMLHVRQAELRGWRRVLKAGWERLAAATILLVISPLLLGMMLAIRLDSRGPAIFRQTRIGRDDRPFTMFKLRTMCDRAEERCADLASHNEADGLLFKVRKDPRITRLGGFLRRYSLDELPQLLNVVLGDMALVGPRPPLPTEVAGYADDVRRRLVVKPGVTGLWQVSGRSDLPWDEAVRLDLHYVDNWSLGLDLSIMLRTARAVVSHQGAY
ncbi:sugar transferase [Nocardioides sp. JQ2195]|uniref:sugar transferase n=1 Tax=Nocardioides sp. JQ2195 TaxID=2592334 RepID=UPI00143E56CC|nr:sugar transferase [Nocardioides sp. JQ2195]QIX25960.1 sugar transferase [Nocardioides sp. JQ2195]